MEFTNILKNICITALQDGCSKQQFYSIIDMIRFFEYNHLANNIIANTKENENKFSCDENLCRQIFDLCV
jgi:hypothetical protein